MHYVSILSTVVTFVFAAAVFERYRRRGGTHLVLWGVGLLFYGLGTLSEALLIFTFHPLLVRLWYLSGAMLTAAWLGQGTIHLLVRKRGLAWSLTAALAAASVAAAGLMLVAPLAAASPAYDLSQPVSAQYKEMLVRNGAVVALTILLNIYGTLALVGGALYSAYLFWRKRVLVDRLLGNVLIAGGALMPAMAGSLIKAGLADWLYLSEFLGVVLMYAGFLRATAAAPAMEAGAATASAQ